ncbi:MAG: TolC family protein [Candidatus Pseudobacter hemicellulosilyticus]|uniref:TolC family protein n=1 Tax=Candidatus Pseudobacter hemicellulosilyticus TaxID=3121375 RepID=A0AAJ5WTD1_9BACT|nr:MAG: TolC family protein [Pseudobacter sp.]
MKKTVLIGWCAMFSFQASAQFFNETVKDLYQQATGQNDSLQLFQLKQEQIQVDRQSVRFNYLPRVSFTGTYTRLNDDIVFPENLQQLLMGTQALLIKEKLGMGFNATLPPTVQLQPVDPIQRKDILKTTVNGQWLLFSGFKVSNGLKAYQHQQQAVSHLTQKQQARLWLDISDVYDKMALVSSSDNILVASANILKEQRRFVEGAISNGLATPLDRKKIELAEQQLKLKQLENQTSKRLLQQKMQQLTGAGADNLSQLQPVLTPLTTMVTEAAAERAEILALNEGIEATHYQEKAALADYVPKVAAFGQYELREKDLSLLDPKWFAGLRLQWNIFDGLSARNSARKAALDRKALEVQKKAAQDLITLGRDKAQEDYLLATQKVTLKQAEIALTEDTYDFVNKQYRNGLTGIKEVLDALNDLEKARFGLQQALYEQRRAVLQSADINGVLLQHI